MSISAINFGNNTVAQTTQNNRPKAQIPIQKNNVSNQQISTTHKELPKLSPLQAGLFSGAIWFGAGLAIERITGAMFKSMKSSFKVSLAMNGIVGLVAGTLAYIGTKKEAKQEQQAQKIS